MKIHDTQQAEKKALIIGGGIAGLLAARVLSEYYDDVLIIERDSFPEKPGTRPGTPQSFHLHQVLPRGEMIIEQLFPNFLKDLWDLGAFQMKQRPAQMINPYGVFSFPGDEKAITYSRALLEWALRQRVQSISTVRFLPQHEVVELSTNEDHTRVVGAYVRQRGQVEEQKLLSADLVLDTSGRSSKLPGWLSSRGYKLAEDERIEARIGYSTRTYKMPSHTEDVPALVVIDGDPASDHAIGGVLKSIEGNVWMACLAGIDGHYPPTDAQGFDEGLTQLISPVIAEALQQAEPLTEPRGYRLPACIRHHYEMMERWPKGLLVMGDALCFFDPIYGQGMTLAAIEADTIATSLREEQGQIHEQRLLQQMQESIYPAWWRSALEDLRWPGVTHSGPEQIKGRELLHRYFDFCLKQATEKFGEAAQTGSFNPRYMDYLMMNWLFISPRAVVNTDMLNFLLESETPARRQAILDHIFEGYDQTRIAEILEEIVPDFHLGFEMPSFFAQ